MVSVIIPAKNEQYLQPTIEDILKKAKGEIEVLVILDGYLPDPPIDTKDKRVTFFHFKETIGQRAAVNYGAKRAKGKYILKTDGHSMFDEGFDVKLAADCEYDWTVIPRMHCLDTEKWQPKFFKRTDYMFIRSPYVKDKPFRVQYYDAPTAREFPEEYRASKKAEWRKGDICDVMTGQGACWFQHKDRFWELDGLDESGHGVWGQVGVEIALKAWLSGGSLKVNKKTWFAHLFRKKFPYKASGRQQANTRKYSIDFWTKGKWKKQKRPLEWIYEKFKPVPSWKHNDLTILYYTANVVAKGIEFSVVRALKRLDYPIISISQEPMDLGTNIVVPKKRSMVNIYKQVLTGAKKATTEYVALCEDDCFYVPEHFKHRPKKPFGYNLNRWLLHLDEKIFSYRKRPILSQCIAHRETLIKCLEERFKGNPFEGEMGIKDKYPYETFTTKEPNLVICHRNSTQGGRKYLGKDAEPRYGLPVWGRVENWIRKFKRREHWRR